MQRGQEGSKGNGKVLVTGGAGFIGSHVAAAYQERGWSVTVVDDLSSGKRENVPEGVRFEELDIRDPAVHGVFEREGGFQIINHHAAQMDVRHSVQDPKHDAEINVLGLLNVLEAGREFGTERVLFISSGGVVYGAANQRPIPEGAEKKPESPYGVTKLVGEHYLRCYRLLHGLEYAALRYSNVYGPRQDPHGEAGVVAIFSQLIREGRPLTIFGDGEQTRDYIYVGDVVSANMVLSEAPLSPGQDLDDRGFNVGTGRETSVNELARALMTAADRETEIEYAPARPGELEWNSLSTDKLRELGWEVEVDLVTGLQRTYRALADAVE